MYTAYEIKKDLEKSDNQPHLVLSRLFQILFDRKLHGKEWGFLRRLIKLYGPLTVYDAMLSSAHIDGATSPLNYISKICISTTKEEKSIVNISYEETKKIIEKITRRE